MANASSRRIGPAPVARLRGCGLSARDMSTIAAVHPTSAQRWLLGSTPRGPALVRLRRAARMAAAWPEGAPPFADWMSASSPALSGRSPMEWLGVDGADLPLAECWREATGATAAGLNRAFPDLHDRGDAAGDATLNIVKRAMRDFEMPQYLRTLELMAQVAEGPLHDFQRIQGNYAALLEGSSIAAAIAKAAVPSMSIADGFAPGSVAAILTNAQPPGLSTAVAASYPPHALEAAARIADPLRAATVEILGALEPYRRLMGNPVPALADLVGILPATGLSFSHDEIAKLYASVVPSSSWLASLSVAVDGSLMSATAAALDAQARLVTPFAIEGAAWRGWLPRFPNALEITAEADPGWLSAEAHVHMRTAIAASAPDRETREDRDWIEAAVEKSRRLSWDLDMRIPGTTLSLGEALEAYAPSALTSVRGAMEAIAGQRHDAARQAAVSLRAAAQSLGRALAPDLPENTTPRERLQAAVGAVLSDRDHGKMVSAQIEVLTNVAGPTSAAVHGRSDDVAWQEVTLKGLVSAFCAVIAACAQSGGTIPPIRN